MHSISVDTQLIQCRLESLCRVPHNIAPAAAPAAAAAAAAKLAASTCPPASSWSPAVCPVHKFPRMKTNYNITIEGQKVILVPYRHEHVEQYHVWMQDPSLQEATASEPLTMEEEYAMQKIWAEDEDKCTFILLDRSLPDTPGTGSHGGGMAGDVNFFFNDHDDRSIAEIEIMVAEQSSRRNGLATEALQLFMAYGVSSLGVTKFRAKIGEGNAASLALFMQKLGYKEVSRSAVFKEVTLELAVEGDVAEQLQAAGKELKLAVYDTV